MIPIYFDELAELLRACTRLRHDECSPVQLRTLVANHLSQTNAGLAKRVMAFDSPQLLALSAFVLQAQVLVGMTAEATATWPRAKGCGPVSSSPSRTAPIPYDDVPNLAFVVKDPCR
ncbi:hypothetical protein PX52LOC_07616 [Limnoglobus roseus]|uniref:Uncharacterized protein n=1 Tax=Limnoglobus roseus TaxID=2598579 RepID=A0A5C1AS29_9BACT|nr:hypothetical protein PX52LOC_07616 [Limnoglobus roseus]